ncbi:zinc finger protein 148-like [Diaphorina citri]|uniref:Zinc finger protein 148-like n=1 Tax=Diaphorina citri TaxID=121845 RepID=A0A3Q0JAA7_DIACI|nr:zinc finger protein 148-like [Diaphorina citri]
MDCLCQIHLKICLKVSRLGYRAAGNQGETRFNSAKDVKEYTLKTDQPGTIKFEPTADNIDTLTISRICARCRLDFVDSRNLRSHFLKFRNQASFSCELCHKSYVRSDILQEHQRVHMCENLYKCVRCFYSANQIYDIYEHMHSVHKINIDNIFKCPYDDVMFRDKETLFQHIGCHRILDRSSGDSANDSVSEKAVPGRDIKEETASDDEADMLPSTLLECNLDQVERKDPKTEVKIPSTVPPEDKLDDDLVDEILDEIDKSTLIDVDYVKNDMVINTENYSHVNSDNDRSIRMLCYFKNIKCAYCTKIFIVKIHLKICLKVSRLGYRAAGNQGETRFNSANADK